MNKAFIEAELGITTLCFDNLTSTNDYGKEAKLDGEVVITALSQSSGRGRVGKSFFSPVGGLYFSYVFTGSPEPSDLLTIRVAVAVSETIAEICHIDTEIKWVNDILLEGKKICGILCESVPDRIIIGIGINLSDQSFPDELLGIAGCIHSDDSKIREKLICGIVRRIKEHPDYSDVLDYYRSHSYLTGKEIYFVQKGRRINGFAEGIADNGNLIVRTDNGTIELCSGEVSVRPLF